MRSEQAWHPTKYQAWRGGWRGSRDTRYLARSSRVMADLASGAYSQAVASYARGDLLDLACGTAPAYGMYRPLVSSVTCVDWASTPHPSPYLDLEADLRAPLPLEDESFDTVLLTDVLEHMPYPDRLMAELTRILRPGGTAIIGVPFAYGIHEAPHDHHRYTRFRLELLCDDHALQVEELRPYGGPPAVLLDLAAKALGAVPVVRVAAGFPATLARRLPRPSPSTALPLGYLLVARKPDA